MRILVITPDFELTGANVALLELLGILTDKGINVRIIGAEDGEYREKFERIGCSIYIRPYVTGEYQDDWLYDEYDFVLLNSSSVHYYALLFQNTSMRVFWLFHESYEQLSVSQINFVHLGLLSSNFTFLAVSDKVKRSLNKLYGVKSTILHIPVADVSDCKYSYSVNKGRVKFFIPGAYTVIKGQDILLKAITSLPQKYYDISEYIFAGYSIPSQEEYIDRINKIAALMPNVKIYPALSRDRVYELYRECDCVVAPSRTDSLPTTIIEALMFSKVCIVSDGTGMSDYIADCENGFIFHNEDSDELCRILMAVIDNITELSPIAMAGRKIYEDRFSPMAVQRAIENIFILHD